MALCKVDGSRFNRMFGAHITNVNYFKFGCRMILTVDSTHLSRPYKMTLLAACAVDADNHLFSFAYGIECNEKVEK